jgi:hypothetical protein
MDYIAREADDSAVQFLRNSGEKTDAGALQQLLIWILEIRVIFCFSCVLLFFWFPRNAAGEHWVEG